MLDLLSLSYNNINYKYNKLRKKKSYMKAHANSQPLLYLFLLCAADCMCNMGWAGLSANHVLSWALKICPIKIFPQDAPRTDAAAEQTAECKQASANGRSRAQRRRARTSAAVSNYPSITKHLFFFWKRTCKKWFLEKTRMSLLHGNAVLVRARPVWYGWAPPRASAWWNSMNPDCITEARVTLKVKPCKPGPIIFFHT